MNETTRRELGESDSPIEDELEEAFTRMVSEGSQRLHRSWREVLVTGFFGGTEVATGVLAFSGVAFAQEAADKLTVVLAGKGKFEVAPHGEGNVYAPDVMRDGKLFKMWYGGQGKDGHDRIAYAESVDAVTGNARSGLLRRGAGRCGQLHRAGGFRRQPRLHQWQRDRHVHNFGDSS